MATTIRPPRPDEKPTLQRRERRWLPVLFVLATLLAVVGGGYVTAAALSEPAGAPITVSRVVRIQPLSGWAFAGWGRLSSGEEFARLSRGVGSVDVIAFPRRGGTAQALAVAYTGQLDLEVTRLSVSSQLAPVRTASGSQGVRFSYTGVDPDTSASIDGEVTVILGPSGSGAVFNGWTPAGLLPYASHDIGFMVDKAIVA
ncbi:MAG: hypothetical protein QOG88_429 [Actinomycetota bacterium]|nr:hypothetical protein [Actinomycetota bacterium]